MTTQIFRSASLRPAGSIKSAFFPQHEPLFTYQVTNGQLTLTDPAPPSEPRVLLGVRPCQAAALPVLDHVFNWDYPDDFYNLRREATTVISVACSEYDEHCFCTSVGLGPACEQGSDAMLLPLGGDEYEVRCFTEKGRRYFDGKTEPSDRTAPIPEGPPKRFTLPPLEFDSPVWQQAALACLGCGACAFTCPTCHCFDIVDEGTPQHGARVKNWDSCQFTQFTIHAGGHNPRDWQHQRQRQRILHKFKIYPDKFGPLLCTGCGNCTRNCPAGLGVLNVLKALEADHAEHLQA